MKTILFPLLATLASLLRSRAALHLEILPPIEPSGSSFSDILRLRDATRTQILRHCGESDRSEDHIVFTETGPERV